MQGIMRSFTSCQATDMERLLWFSLLLTCLPVTESMEKANCYLLQPKRVIWRTAGQSAILHCNINSHCSAEGLQYEWFSFKENVHIHFKPLEPSKYKLDGASLHIKSLHVNDSGIYHCAAVSHGDPAPNTQHVGLGTTLVVRNKVMVRNILLWLSFVLLALYSLVVLTLIVKKFGCRGKRKTHRNNSSKKKQFRDVLQEMYHRRNLDESKQTVSRNRSQVEAASADNSADDIYQNV